MPSRKESREMMKNKSKLNKSKKLLASALLLGTMGTAVSSPVISFADSVNSGTTSSKLTPAQFLAESAGYAKQVASENDLYASVMIAQSILESGWGGSALASYPNYNLFGVKGSYNGQSATMPTQEYINGKWITINAQFRKYPSYKESFEDNARVLKTTSFSRGNYYYSGAWKSRTNSYKDATAYLTGRYATAPNYAESLNRLIETYNLTQYDTPSTGSSFTPSMPTTNSAVVTNVSKTFATTASLNIRQTASTSSAIVGSVANGQKVTVTKMDTNGVSVSGNKTWYYVDGKGWLSATYLKEVITTTNPVTTTPVSTSSTTNKTFTTTATLNIRQSASTSSGVAGSVASGTKVTATKVETNGTSVSGNKTWYYINGKGWVSGYYLKEAVATTTNKPATNPNTTTTSVSTISNVSKTFTTTASLNVRNTASTSASVVGSVTNGAKVTATKVETNGTSVSGNKTWYYINGKGWVSGYYLKEVATSTVKSSTNTAKSSNTINLKTHTVKSGDTLWAISKTYGTSVSNIKSWSGLKSDTIWIGQKLTVKK